jgi:hypothetical protein
VRRQGAAALLRVYDWALRQRRNLQTLLLWTAIASFVVTALTGVLVEDRVLGRFHTAPLLLLAPLWVRLRLDELPDRPDRRLAVDAVAFGLAFLRFATGDALPFSGHMLFLTYSALVTRHRLYRAAAGIGIAVTTWFKFRIWDGELNWAAGLLLGVSAAALYTRAERGAPVALARGGDASVL